MPIIEMNKIIEIKEEKNQILKREIPIEVFNSEQIDVNKNNDENRARIDAINEIFRKILFNLLRLKLRLLKRVNPQTVTIKKANIKFIGTFSQ